SACPQVASPYRACARLLANPKIQVVLRRVASAPGILRHGSSSVQQQSNLASLGMPDSSSTTSENRPSPQPQSHPICALRHMCRITSHIGIEADVRPIEVKAT